MNKFKAFFDFKWWFYDFVKVTGFIPIMLYLRTKYYWKNKNQKKEFKKNQVMIAANHKGFLDPFLMVSVFWTRRIGIIGTKELFDTKIKKLLFTGFRVIYIDKENVSMSTFKTVKAVINDGHSVGIFPEGTVAHDSDQIDDFKPGVIMMAMMAKVPIYPVYFAVKKHWYNRQRVYIGEKFDVFDYFEGKKPNSEKLTEVAAILRQKIVELENIHKERYE